MRGKNILITGARSISTLDLIHLFDQKGHQVFISDTRLLHPAYFSCKVHASFAYPSPKMHPEDFIKKLCEIIKTNHIELLIPTCEEIFYISKFLDRLQRLCSVFCAPLAQMMQLHNKWEFSQLQKKHHIPSPKSFLVHDMNDLMNPQLPSEYILKPVFSRASQFIIKGYKNHPPTQLKYNTNNPWMAQEWIDGKHFCSYSICYEGQINAHSCYPVRFTVDGNSCISFMFIDHPKIYSWVKHFVALENYTGQIAFDFIETQKGDLMVIECNPRTTSGLHLLSENKEVAEAFLKQSPNLIQPPIGYQKQISTGMLLYGWKKHNQHLGLWTYLKELFSVKDTLFRWKDPFPFLMLPFMVCIYLKRSREAKTSLASAFTNDIEWNEDQGVKIDPLNLTP